MVETGQIETPITHDQTSNYPITLQRTPTSHHGHHIMMEISNCYCNVQISFSNGRKFRRILDHKNDNTSKRKWQFCFFSRLRPLTSWWSNRSHDVPTTMPLGDSQLGNFQLKWRIFSSSFLGLQNSCSTWTSLVGWDPLQALSSGFQICMPFSEYVHESIDDQLPEARAQSGHNCKQTPDQGHQPVPD